MDSSLSFFTSTAENRIQRTVGSLLMFVYLVMLDRSVGSGNVQ